LALFVEAAASPKFALEAGHRDPLAVSITAVDEMTGRPRLVRCLKPFCPQSSPLFCKIFIIIYQNVTIVSYEAPMCPDSASASTSVCTLISRLVTRLFYYGRTGETILTISL
jgi:hypothetical protein